MKSARKTMPAASGLVPKKITVIVLALLASGCAAIRFGATAPDVSGSWEGSVVVDAQRIPGTLTVEQEGRVLDLGFVAPEFELNAQGTGEISEEGELWMDLSYNLQCPGNARLEGRISEDANRMSGTLEAVDCTGTVTGTFSFTR